MSTLGYSVKLLSPEENLSSGLASYWNSDFSSLIQAVNKSKSVCETIFPQAVLDASRSCVIFSVMDENGKELLKQSASLRDKSIPDACMRTLVAAIEQIHAWAEDPRVPSEKRAFCKGFRLPDPKEDPDSYRLTGGMFSRKLHVLWGYQKEGTESVLPGSKISSKWDDAHTRKDIVKLCQGGLLRRVFRLKNFLLVGVIALLLYFVAFLPVKCPIHLCKVADGAYNYFLVEDKCPMRCTTDGCNRHLNDKNKCLAHVCRKCGRLLPITNNQGGVCDDCFWDIN